MKAITICQPYASAIIEGVKTIENRNWKTNYRGQLLIHAGISKSWFTKIPFHQYELIKSFKPFDQLPMGMILGTVLLIGIANGVWETKDGNTYKNDPFAAGPYCWILKNPRKLKNPIPYRGWQGIFEVPNQSLAPEP